ncbi:hypothetical protein B0H12DRAFT_462530 [Mycena haematopus]|nr:hypothetical protein B0H12DRAFT_462530 [Mycena haematopus]
MKPHITPLVYCAIGAARSTAGAPRAYCTALASILCGSIPETTFILQASRPKRVSLALHFCDTTAGRRCNPRTSHHSPLRSRDGWCTQPHPNY